MLEQCQITKQNQMDSKLYLKYTWFQQKLESERRGSIAGWLQFLWIVKET
jgi:hypothetical protein